MDRPIGPNPCQVCGGEYGEHRLGCRLATKTACEPQTVANTDREIWRQTPGDFHSPSIHVTETGGIGIQHQGTVQVKTIGQWARLADDVERLSSPKKQTFSDDRVEIIGESIPDVEHDHRRAILKVVKSLNAASDFSWNLAQKTADITGAPLDKVGELADLIDADSALQEPAASIGRLELAIQEAAESICDAIDMFANRLCDAYDQDCEDEQHPMHGAL